MIAGNVQGPYEKRDPLTQFFNGTLVPYDTTQQPAAITWIGFPNLVAVKFGGSDDLRWKVADSSRIFQDEYLEWSLSRDANNNIATVVFTCEAPEMNDLDLSPTEEADLFLTPFDDPTNRQKWLYNPTNPYNFGTNTGKIIHLIQPANTLGAEIDIAAQATVIRKDSKGQVVTNSDQLIKCSKYGNPNRNSDPTIGSQINGLARQGNSLSISDPVALYMHKFDSGKFRLDASGNRDGDSDNMIPVPESWFEFQRGDIKKSQGLRLRIQNNTGLKTNDGSRLLTVSDLFDKSKSVYVNYGAQFADYITMGVAGVVIPGGKPSEPMSCPAAPTSTAAGSENKPAVDTVKTAVASSSAGPRSTGLFRPGKRFL
ncbi:hypothetical protein M7I_0978 [Glarea lozoyensis 74030]|uniref:Uncharacterized protein n=1 Tax=Glarea lozoyensis (strain ATCC 74030 / MF5533) TaxID=1104152 RepID=H0EEU4_GLAL7|nr:hypothetical protein M7I_0978 [Glarea lozoyensis 74030]